MLMRRRLLHCAVPVLSRSAKAAVTPEDSLNHLVADALARADTRGAVAGLRAAFSGGERIPPSVLGRVLHALECEHSPKEALAFYQELAGGMVARESWPEGMLSQLLRLRCAVSDLCGAREMVEHLEQQSLLRHRSIATYLRMAAALESSAESDWIEQKAARLGVELDEVDYANLMWVHRADLCRLESLFGNLAELPGTISEASRQQIVAAWGESPACYSFDQTEVDVASGRCGHCGGTLQPLKMSAEAQRSLLEDIRTKLVPSPQQDPRTFTAFETFRRFIESSRGRYDVIVDGANVGFFGVSNWGRPEQKGRTPPDYVLINNLVELLKRHQLRPLVLLHHRHLEPGNLRSSDAKRFAERWLRAGEIYATPARINDDILWLYASIYLSSANSAGSAKQNGVMVVTNDLMRDHHFALLSPRHFQKWRQHHQIGFGCERDHDAKFTHILLKPPPPFAQAPQRAVSGGRGLHLPVRRDNGDVQWWCGLPTAG